MFWKVLRSAQIAALIFSIGGVPASAQTDTCDLEGLWKVKGAEVPFTLTAVYTFKNGVEALTGKYAEKSPSTETGEAKGTGRTGDWTLTFVSKGPGNSGYSRDLIGEGARDPKTGLFRVDGKFTVKKHGEDTGQEGGFELTGRCVATPKK